MERLTLAAVCGLLLSLPIFSLQAQQPKESPSPGFRADTQNAPVPILQTVPDKRANDSAEFSNELTLQLGTGQKVHEDEEPSAWEKYPIWILIKPDGIQFLQNQEEIARNQHAIPPNALLLGCMTVKFEGASVEQKPDFQLNCEDFVLAGRYGTQQNLDVKGGSLTFSTRSKQIRLKGTDDLPLELHSVDIASETRIRADEMTLQLDSGPKTITRYIPRTVVRSGLQVKEYVPVREAISQGTSFQLSAQNITALEVIANPAPGGDAPKWDPDLPESIVPTYDDPSVAPGSAPNPQSSNVPFYFKPSNSEKYYRSNEPQTFDPNPKK